MKKYINFATGEEVELKQTIHSLLVKEDEDALYFINVASLEEIELEELNQWFTYYDNQIAQYNRCQRTGAVYDKDIVALDKQANDTQIRIREIKNILKIN